MAVPGRGVISLQSSINKGSADDFEYSCGQCLVDELDVEAHGFCVVCHVYLCVTCFRAHSRNQASRQHKLLGKSELSNVKIAQESAIICTEKCPVHGQEIVKFFCPEHEALCCNDCVILNHRNCEIDYIPDKCSDIGESSEYQETLEELETRQKIVNNVKVAANKTEGEMVSSVKTVMNEIRKFEEEIHDHIGKLRKKVESEVEIKRTTNQQVVGTVVDTCSEMETNVEQLRKEVLDTKHKNNLAQLYIAIKRSKNALKSGKVNECIKMLKDTTTRFCFERSIDIDALPEKSVCLGTLRDIGDKSRDAIISKGRKDKPHKLVCVILYIGSSHMTFGFSFVSDPKSCLRKRWFGRRRITEKGPTDLLINPDGQSVCAFGYEAGQKYYELVDSEEDEKYFYYHGDYILKIYGDMDKNRKFASDVSGKKLLSISVLSALIGVLKDEAISSIRKYFDNMVEDLVQFVLTVPDRFEKAREALKEAAEQTGIVSEDLTIMFETEAAFMYIQDPTNYFADKYKERLFQLFGEGARYLILDARGTLYTITVYEVSNDQPAQLYHEANESCGGNSVTEEAENFVSSLYGQEIMQHCKTTDPEEYRDIMFSIEDDLRSCKTENSPMCIGGKATLNDIVKERTGGTVHKLIHKQITEGKIEAIGDKLRIDSSIWKKFFQRSVSTITSHIHSILQDKTGVGCKAIVMIGGFSQSPILQEGLKREFSDLLVVVPTSPDLAIMLGAVSLGHSL